MSDDTLFAVPRKVKDLIDCHFYHSMEILGYGAVTGDWDLRAGFEDYLGKADLSGQRVLEIGPASGFLTFELERRGAEVVSIEVTDEPGLDFVPYPASKLKEILGPRRVVMQRLKNSYWLSHAAFGSKAKVHYGDVYHLPSRLGSFHTAIMGSVLLHCRSPLHIIEECGKRARSLIIVDMFYPELEGKAIIQLAPDSEDLLWHTWWHFSAQFFIQFLKVMGFVTIETSTHSQLHRGTAYTLFTIVARR